MHARASIALAVRYNNHPNPATARPQRINRLSGNTSAPKTRDHFTYGIGFELNLPDSWIGRFEMQGGSGSSSANPRFQIREHTWGLAEGCV